MLFLNVERFSEKSVHFGLGLLACYDRSLLVHFFLTLRFHSFEAVLFIIITVGGHAGLVRFFLFIPAHIHDREILKTLRFILDQLFREFLPQFQVILARFHIEVLGQ